KKIAEVEKKDQIRNWKNPLRGDEIMKALDLKPGPIIGRVKEDVKEAIMEGEIPNEHDAAHDYMMKNKDKYLNSRK
ncbi:MAG TPA: hypothetical protein VJ877_01200, partial [Bacteroidales bacterium]|nr:hypothetical protein [Bacteroidales bacterium]